jgi:hypothetical protein
VWNQVIRANGLADYLCLTCIVQAFAAQQRSFTAQLWGKDSDGLPLEIVINGQQSQDAVTVSDENTELRVTITALRQQVESVTAECERLKAENDEINAEWGKRYLGRQSAEQERNEALAERDRLSNALAAARAAMTWRPIETAPKDRTRILVWPYWGDNRPAEVQWREMKRTPGRWETTGGLVCPSANPTHWMPLPAPPVEASGAEVGGMMQTKFKCVVCGKMTTGRIPRANGRFYGDGTFRYPRRHNVEGKPCPGNREEAEWVDVETGAGDQLPASPGEEL